MRKLIAVSAAVSALLAAVAASGSQGATTPSSLTATGANCSNTSVGFTPLDDLGQGTYQGYEGGLYPGGTNTPPSSYLSLGLAASSQVQPLAANGAPSPSGRIVLMSVGMSNAYLEFASLIDDTSTDEVQAGDLEVGGTLTSNPQVELVNGATPKWDAPKIIDNESSYLGILKSDLADSGVTGDQVQAVWLYDAIGNENNPFPTDSQDLESDLDTIISMLSANFPNLRMVYLSSREYAGYAVTSLNPEPYAYESGFAVKWTVAERIDDGSTALPWVAWGPYLWADGTIPRSDGLVWLCSDFESDGTHPSLQGREKAAGLLDSFFTTDPTADPWFDHAVTVLPGPLATTSTTPNPTTVTTPNSGLATVRWIRVKRRTVTILLSCSGPAGGTCSVAAKLTKTSKHRTVTLAKAHKTIANGSRGRIRLVLDGTGKRMLARMHSLKAKLTITKGLRHIKRKRLTFR